MTLFLTALHLRGIMSKLRSKRTLRSGLEKESIMACSILRSFEFDKKRILLNNKLRILVTKDEKRLSSQHLNE